MAGFEAEIFESEGCFTQRRKEKKNRRRKVLNVALLL
jgi:hypothetical protein